MSHKPRKEKLPKQSHLASRVGIVMGAQQHQNITGADVIVVTDSVVVLNKLSSPKYFTNANVIQIAKHTMIRKTAFQIGALHIQPLTQAEKIVNTEPGLTMTV